MLSSRLMVSQKATLLVASGTILGSFLLFMQSVQIVDYTEEKNAQRGAENHTEKRKPEKLKNILYFTQYYDFEDWNFGFGRDPFIENNCSVTSCYVTNDRDHLSSLSEFDALIFFSRDLEKNYLQMPNHLRRRENQVYVFFTIESPHHDGLDFNNYRFRHYFNWTMTYRSGSDVFNPYGYMTTVDPPAPSPMVPPTWRNDPSLWNTPRLPVSAERRRLVAWMVSNCRTASKREDYVKELRKYIPVDQFGGCNDNPCNKTGNCYEELGRKYMFYLSFENSRCTDYITEKFWNALDNNMVPVVLGSGSYEIVAPPHSYINSKDFKTAKDLADYLLWLRSNIQEYSKYFWWKDKYRVVTGQRKLMAESMCRMCELLQTPGRKTYEDLGGWWEGECQ